MIDNDSRPPRPYNAFRTFKVLVHKPTPCTFSWWVEAPQDGFYHRCRQEWHERMAGSEGERAVSRLQSERSVTLADAWGRM